MPYLTKAALPESGLTHHIIANISSYSQLVELNLRLGPEPRQWGNKHTSLKTLRWEFPTGYSDRGTIDSWNRANHVLNIAGTVFPEIVELDISTCERKDSDAAPYSLSQASERMQNVLLPRLCSFRYQGGVHDKDREPMLHFIQRHHGSLISLETNFGFIALEQKLTDYVLQVITAAPKLKSLIIPTRERRRWQSHTLPVWSDSAPSLASSIHGIEFFQMWNIGRSFSPDIGELFSGWNSLRVLKIGAPLYEKDEHDGRPHFDDVAPVRELLITTPVYNCSFSLMLHRKF